MYTEVDTCTESHIASHNLCPNPLAPVIQMYELPLATICYNLQQSYYTSHSQTHTHMNVHTYLTQCMANSHLLRLERICWSITCLTFKGEVTRALANTCVSVTMLLPNTDVSEGQQPSCSHTHKYTCISTDTHTNNVRGHYRHKHTGQIGHSIVGWKQIVVSQDYSIYSIGSFYHSHW